MTTDDDKLMEDVALALWQNEARRAAPSILKYRTAEAFTEAGPAERALWLGCARALLPLIHARDMRIAEKVREAIHTEAVNHGVTNTSFAQDDDGWINDMDPSYIRGQGLLEFARKTIRALDLNAIIGASDDQ